MSSSNQQQANLAAQLQLGQLTPFLYSYQLAMAQAQAAQAQASNNKGKGKGNGNSHLLTISFCHFLITGGKSSTSSSMAEMQRALEMQRQYIEMLSQTQQMPNQRGHSNWKNN